jgi:hypothetical protein
MPAYPPYPGAQTPAAISDRRRRPPAPRADLAGAAAYTPIVVNPARSRSAVGRVPLIVGIAVVLLAVLAVPIKQRCGGPGFSCASTLDNNGNIRYYYEVEPVGVYLAEIVTGSNITLFYTSGEDLVRPR